MAQPWWTFEGPVAEQPGSFSDAYNRWAVGAFMKRSLETGKPALRFAKSGELNGKATQFNEAIISLRGLNTFQGRSDNRTTDYTYVFEEGFIYLDFSIDLNSCTIFLLTDDEELYKKVISISSEFLLAPAKQGSIYTLMARGQNLVISSLGKTAIPFETDNYTQEVMASVSHIMADLVSPNPCGKLSIIDGPPGTGKTTLLRMIIGALDAPFILVPAHQLIDWTGPGILSVLLEKKSEPGGFDKPPIFVLEDADDCLVPRTSNNMNAISALLNLSDGILGSVLDTRILATTNAKVDEIDEALIRDGRLCRRVLIGDLGVDQANRIYKRISGKDENLFEGSTSLAEIYKAAKDPERAKEIVRRHGKKIGFQP